MILADFVNFFLSFVLRYGTILSTQTTVTIYPVSVCVCLSVVPSIENKEWGRRIIVVTEEHQGLKGIGLQEIDRVVDPFDRQPTPVCYYVTMVYLFFF